MDQCFQRNKSNRLKKNCLKQGAWWVLFSTATDVKPSFFVEFWIPY